MRKVCRLAREVLDIAAREIKPGVTTDHIDKVVHRACMERNVCFLWLTTYAFRMLIEPVVSVTAELCSLP